RLEPLDLRGEEAPLLPRLVEVHPLPVDVEVERQVVGGLDGAEEVDLAALALARAAEVDGVAVVDEVADARDAARRVDLQEGRDVGVVEQPAAHAAVLV